jgi:mannosyltransferase OCH1-like enzyme
MIPKKIHYCWFGPKEQPRIVKDCIESWKKWLPEYEIQRWDETNVDLSHPFLKKAYTDKMYAFVADYVRLNSLYNEGGIYLDTDMLLLKPLDQFLHYKAFIGLESENYISCGIIGAIPYHPYIYNCLNFYRELKTDRLDYKQIVIPKIFTQIYREMYCYSGPIKKANHKNLRVFDKDFFYAYPNPIKSEPFNEYLNYITSDSYAVHLWHKSWKKKNALKVMREGNILKSLGFLCKEFLISNQTINSIYLRKIASALKQHLKNAQ